MENDFISRATFSEVYRFLKDRPGSGIYESFKGLFGVALLFFPALMCRDVGLITNIATGATLAGAGVGAIVSKSAQSVVSLFQKKDRGDYADRYNQMQIAQVMLVYASYFDAISRYLPNENGEITISSDVRQKISRDGFDAYVETLKNSAQQNKNMSKLLEFEIAFPDPARTFSQYKEELKRFYEALNKEFIIFFRTLSFFRELSASNDSIDLEQREFFTEELQKMPERAVYTYEKYYFELAKDFPEFTVWANHAEHIRLEAQIDIGFQKIAEELKRLYACVNHKKMDVEETLERYRKKYDRYIKKDVIEDTEKDFGGDIVFPTKEEIFVPQAFQALTYHGSLQLEIKEAWKDAFYGEDIGRYIRSVFQHPKYSEYPMLILGLPGAGKTLLCHMLAAQILAAEFYVIIIRLRDAIAENTIMKQIDNQIEKDFGDDCKWNHLRKHVSDKPFLLIFDGYDELLQASGKAHSDYLNKILEFQEEQRSYYRIFVRCIVTSRETLIDKASIPAGCPVLRLCDFDDKRIAAWSRIWNQANERYFTEHQIDRLKIASSGKVRELAGQPLLLLMLALYVMNGNKLQEKENISRAELYDKLIRDFVVREKEKDAGYHELPKRKKEKEVLGGFHYLGIAALGMYNRRQLFIRTVDLNQDIQFLEKENSSAVCADEDGLEKGEKLVGSFFFIHSSKSTEKKDGKETHIAAYEFLHNTFGEFLTAHFILELVFCLIKRLLREEDPQEGFIWTEKIKKEWHISLAYTPLFTRPVVLQMICELSEIMAKEQGIDSEKIREALDELFRYEISRIIKGNAFSEIDGTLNMQGNPLRHPELMLHVAAYSINLILLRITVCSNFVDFTESLGTDDDWRKLTQIWRYAFSEEELVALSCLLEMVRTEDGCRLVYRYDKEAANHADSFSKLDKMCRISKVLGEEAAYAVFGAYRYPMNQRIHSVIEREALQIETQYAVKEVMRRLLSIEMDGAKLKAALMFLKKSCLKEKDTAGFYLYCAIVRVSAGQNLLTREDMVQLGFGSAFRMLDQVLGRRERICRWDYLHMTVQEIFKCMYVLPMQSNISMLIDFTSFLGFEIIRLKRSMRQQREMKNFIKNSVFSYCKVMQSVIKRGWHKEFGKIFREFTGEIVFDMLSDRELAEIFRTCLALRRAGEKKHSTEIMQFLCRTISLKDLEYSSEKITSLFFQALVECMYSFAGELAKTPELYYLVEKLFLSGERTIANALLPAYEHTFYHLVCMICDSFGISCGAAACFDWTGGLIWAVQEYGQRMSIQTLKKILEYAKSVKCGDLTTEAEDIILLRRNE